jgi:hypothetical protein
MQRFGNVHLDVWNTKWATSQIYDAVNVFKVCCGLELLSFFFPAYKFQRELRKNVSLIHINNVEISNRKDETTAEGNFLAEKQFYVTETITPWNP